MLLTIALSGLSSSQNDGALNFLPSGFNAEGIFVIKGILQKFFTAAFLKSSKK